MALGADTALIMQSYNTNFAMTGNPNGPQLGAGLSASHTAGHPGSWQPPVQFLPVPGLYTYVPVPGQFREVAPGNWQPLYVTQQLYAPQQLLHAPQQLYALQQMPPQQGTMTGAATPRKPGRPLGSKDAEGIVRPHRKSLTKGTSKYSNDIPMPPGAAHPDIWQGMTRKQKIAISRGRAINSNGKLARRRCRRCHQRQLQCWFPKGKGKSCGNCTESKHTCKDAERQPPEAPESDHLGNMPTRRRSPENQDDDDDDDDEGRSGGGRGQGGIGGVTGDPTYLLTAVRDA